MSRTQYWVAVGIACLGLVLVAVNALTFSANRGLQTEIAERQTFVQQSAQLETLYREIVKALAELSARNSDEQLTKLLADQGITVTVNQPTGTPPAAAGSPP